MCADVAQALNDAYDGIRSALQTICEDPDHQKVKAEAQGLLRKMGTLAFGILTELWSTLSKRFDETSQASRSPELDLNNAVPFLHYLADVIMSHRNQFENCEG